MTDTAKEVLVLGFGYFYLAFSLGWFVGFRAARRERARPPAQSAQPTPTYRSG